jgi:NAD(P)H-dependent flavin oxidoreductase YrpB (nitropropane dioxygenase family)
MGGMTSPALAYAVAQAGALGMLTPASTPSVLEEHLRSVPAGGVVGVNFLVPFLDREALAVAAAGAPLVEFFWGEPDASLVDEVHAGGALASWQVGSADEARAAIDAGCDVVVAQGIEAGGHVRGTTPLLDLLPEVRSSVAAPLVAAGGIGSASSVTDAFAAGADAVRIGTRFVAAAESVAHPDYVDALISSDASDTVLTTAFSEFWSDAPHRVLRSCVEAGERLAAAQSWNPQWPRVYDAGPVASRPLYAGTSVGAVHARQSAADIVAELMSELR